MKLDREDLGSASSSLWVWITTQLIQMFHIAPGSEVANLIREAGREVYNDPSIISLKTWKYNFYDEKDSIYFFPGSPIVRSQPPPPRLRKAHSALSAFLPHLKTTRANQPAIYESPSDCLHRHRDRYGIEHFGHPELASLVFIGNPRDLGFELFTEVQ